VRDIPRRLAIGFVLLTATSAWAAGRAVPIDAGHGIFVAEYVAAVNARDAERFRRLVHPRSLSCITDATRDFYDDWVARAFRRFKSPSAGRSTRW
jgi:hypothetical protein